MSRPAWIFHGLYPWFPDEVPDSQIFGEPHGFPYIGDGTACPARTGWVPSADLYFNAKRLILNIQWQYQDGTSGNTVVVSAARCSRARELLLKKQGLITMSFAHDPPTDAISFEAQYRMEPESRYVVGTNDHYLKQNLSGRFLAFSSTDYFVTDRGAAPVTPDGPLTRVGFLTVVANPGVQSVYQIPIYRVGPNELIHSVNAQLTRQTWEPSEF